jgi:DNA-directed RNA polymerase subunit M/transcription elongation factor TFIIS
MSKTEREKDGRYTCEKCGATFADPQALERHKQIHEHSKREEEKEKELQQGTQQPTVKPDINGNPPGGGPPIMQ